MPQHINGRDRAESVCSAVIHLINRGGIEAVTLRAIASVSGIPTGSLLHHLDNRSRVLNVTAFIVREWLTDRVSRFTSDPLEVLLPDDDESRDLTRAWLAMRELSRTHEGVREALRDGDDEESLRLLNLLDLPWAAYDVVAAFLHGLRDATCRTDAPMTHAVAAAHLRAFRA